MIRDHSKLLGEPHLPKRSKGRPTKADAETYREIEEKVRKDEELPHPMKFRRPVNVAFLADVIGKQPQQVKKRLIKCPVKDWYVRGSTRYPLYDFITAMSYLIPPRSNLEDWFSNQNAASLPPYVNKMFWDSAHQRNRVMRSSGQLWHDDDVLLVLGRAAMMIRQEVKMWIEDLPEKELLNDEQYGALVDATNRLLNDVRKTLVETPQKFSTFSMATTIKQELEEAGVMPGSSEDDESEGGDEDDN